MEGLLNDVRLILIRVFTLGDLYCILHISYCFLQSDWVVDGERLHGITRNIDAMETKNSLAENFGGMRI